MQWLDYVVLACYFATMIGIESWIATGHTRTYYFDQESVAGCWLN